MDISKQRYYEKRGKILVSNLKSRHFDAYYCATKEEALATALSLMPEGSSVGWGGAMSCEQIGLKAGMLVCAIFPILGTILVIFIIRYFKKQDIGAEPVPTVQ